ncbi:hypothetical protein [Chitinimonas lacunae]|uniref:SMI1/KNR4 family protein n=1 Tax=Chitinimonas lacunae TaxID=1963018 RepID=A0ABV8MUG5_9NEIS
MRRAIDYRQSTMKYPILAQALLPLGFVFPPGYRALLASGGAKLEPWWLLSVQSRLFVDCGVALRRHLPDEAWVPFALLETGQQKLLACFAADSRGEPAVWLYDFAQPRRSPWLNPRFRDLAAWVATIDGTGTFSAVPTHPWSFTGHQPE